jgi:MFS family permease
MGDGIGNSILFIIIPLYIAKLPAPLFPLPETVRAGILISLFGLVAGFSQPFTGAVIDRLNRRKPFVVGGLLLLAGATIAFAFASRFAHALIFRALQGLGLAITIPATMALLTNTTRQESRGGSMGVFSTFRVGSLAVGPLLGGLVYDHFGFDPAFFTGAAFVLLGALLVQLWVEEVRADTSNRKRESFRIIDRSLLSPAIVSLGFATFVMAISFGMIAPLEQQFNRRLDESATAFGVAFTALMVARILVQFPIGRLSDRKGRKRLIVAGLILMAVATIPMGLVTATWQLATLRALQGIASGAIAAPTFALAGDISSSGGEARQMSIVTMGFGFGVAVGTLIAGILAVIALALPFFVASVVTFTAAWVVHRKVPETVR